MKLKPDDVSQSSVFKDSNNEYPAELAIDNDVNTVAHSICGNGANLWYRVDFDGKHFVKAVSFVNSFSGIEYASKTRMDGTKVLVINNNKEKLCDTVLVPSSDTREIYVINCGDKIGDGVILRGKEGKADFCIHIREIDVLESIVRGE